jgi:hypothetical protein
MRKSDQVVFTIISDTDYSLSENLWKTYKILWSNYRTMNPKLNEYKIKVKNREREKELYKIFEESNDVSSISCINLRTTMPEFF